MGKKESPGCSVGTCIIVHSMNINRVTMTVFQEVDDSKNR